jgi:hypothetical protein
MPGQPAAAAPPPPVEYVPSPPAAPAHTPVLYLIALKNNNILAAFTYWVEGGQLHYVNLDHAMKQIPLSSVDRELTYRLGFERNLPVQLP